MANKQVTIEFKAEDKGLINQLKKLDNISKQLTSTQTKLKQSNDSHVKSFEKAKQAQSKTNAEIGKLRRSLKALGSNINHVSISQETYDKAVKGSTISLTKLKIKTAEHIVEIKKYNAAIKNAKNSTDRFGVALNSASTGTRILGGSFAVLRSKLLLFNFAMGLGIRKLGHFVGESAKVNAMETAFNTLSGGGRKASIAVDKLTKATDGTVSKMDLFQQANNAMILGVTKNSDEMAEMFDMAQRLGDALGRDTRSSIESLITGIGRQSRMMLDNIGIIVKSDEAYKIHAKVLKKNVDDLTVMERKQAFLNATMEAAKDKISRLPPEIRTARHNFQEMTADIANLTVEIGDFFTPKTEEAAIAISKLAKSIDVDDMKNMTSAVVGIAGAFGAYKIAVLGVNIAMMKLAFSSALATGGISVAIGLIIALMAKLHMGETNQEFEDLTDLVNNLKEELALLEGESGVLAVTTDVLTEAQKRHKEQLDETIKSVESEITSLILKKAALMGANDFDIAKLKLGKEFVKQHPKIIAMLEKEFSIIENLKQAKKEEQAANKNEQNNLKGLIQEKEKEIKVQEELIKERKKVEDIIFANTRTHQFKMLDDHANYYKSILKGKKQQAAIDTWLLSKKEEIDKKISDKVNASNKKNENNLAKRNEKVLKQKKDHQTFIDKLEKDKEAVRQIIFKDDLEFQLNELKVKGEQFKNLKLNAEEQVQLTKWLKDSKATILKEDADKHAQLIYDSQKKIKDAKAIIFRDNLDFQMQELQLEKDKFAKLLTGKENEIALEEWFYNKKRDLQQQNFEETSILYNSSFSAYDAFVTSMLDAEQTYAKTETAIKRAFLDGFIRFLGDMIKEQVKAYVLESTLQKTQNKLTETEAIKNGAVVAAAQGPAALATVLAKGPTYVAAVGVAVAAFTAAQKFERGGEVAGNRHSQGGTLIEAEKGEFVMSRNAVQSIGLENLAQMNQSGSGGVTVNIQGNMIGNEEFVRDTLIPEINKTVGQGLA